MRYRADLDSVEQERELNEYAEPDEPTLFDYGRILWDGKWLILGVVAVGTLAALVMSFNLPRTYIASATLMPLGTDRGAGLASALSGSLGGALGIESPTDKLVAVLQSRRVAGMVVDDLNLIPALAPADGRRPPSRDEAIERVQKTVIKVGGGARGVITVRAQWRDPAVTAAIANAVVAAAARFLNERSISLNFQILDDAVPPSQPAGPKRRVHAALGLVLSGLVGVLSVFLRHAWRTARVRERSVGRDVAEILGRETPVG